MRVSLPYQLVDILYWRRREHCTRVWTGCRHRVPIWNTVGGAYASFHYAPLPHVLTQYWVGPCLGSFLGTAFYVILKQCVIYLVPPSVLPLMITVSWNYWTINPGQAVTDTKMSPQDPVVTIRQRAASLRRKPNDDHEQTPPNAEKSGAAVNRGATDVDGAPVNGQGGSQYNMV